MASYRVRVPVGNLRPGVEPEQLLPAAADAAATLTTVEARDVVLARGVAMVHVRFTAPDDGDADVVARRVEDAVRRLAVAGHGRLEASSRGRWRLVR